MKHQTTRKINVIRKRPTSKSQGFTLLEVLVSITLTALVLGNLFALQSQSKRLSFKAQSSLQKTMNQRAYFNAAWISNQDLDSYLDEFSELGYSVYNDKPLKKVQEQTSPIKYTLESFDIVDSHNDMVLTSVRLKQSITKQH